MYDLCSILLPPLELYQARLPNTAFSEILRSTLKDTEDKAAINRRYFHNENEKENSGDSVES